MNYITATEIQAKALPFAFAGKDIPADRYNWPM
jgi:superfamily II DNA/RNA helicase